MITVGFISLGCAKNLIDSEIMLGHLQQAGMCMTPNPELADVLVVNTCSFIDTAKRESIDVIFEMVDGRSSDEERKEQKIIVAGCLSQRFSKELPELMPEIDAFIGLDQITQIVPIIEKLLSKDKGMEEKQSQPESHISARSIFIPDYQTPRFRLTPDHTAYIKIAEGCNHPCSFCIIPKIRGRHRSRTIESIVKEARMLIGQGVKELNLISQDTTYFGMDRWTDDRPSPTSGVDSSKGESLAQLIRSLDTLEGDFWIRILYTHPAHWSDELISVIAESSKVARYIDIPLQHISDNMLKAMGRETSGDYIRTLIQKIRNGISGVTIRTTFIVGFPGETEEDFQELLNFMEASRFERLGIFDYSREEGTRAYKWKDQVHHMTRKKRRRLAMELQENIVRAYNEDQVGRKIRVLVEEPGIARSAMDAPEIDGTIIVDEKLKAGTFTEVTVSDWRGYDLIARVCPIGTNNCG